jgi:CRP-like cAMP-binding protein
MSVTSGRRRDAARGWADVLAQVPLFEHVSARHLRKIAAVGAVVRFEAGAEIVRPGQAGDAFYVVLDGKGSVRLRGRKPPVTIRSGSYFGEMALLDGEPRSATVAAVTEMTCLRIGRTAFAKILRSEPSVSGALLRTLAARLRDAQDSSPTL